MTAAIRDASPHAQQAWPWRSVIAAIWVIALVLAALGVVRDQWWPAEAGAMFSFATPTATVGYLEGRDAAGKVIAMPSEKFGGLDAYELSQQMRRAMGPDVDFDDQHVLVELATWWNEQYPSERVVEVSLRVRAVEIRDGFGEHNPTLLTVRVS